MPSPVFEHVYLLQSLGWAIANSFWQTGVLWLVYQFITAIDKKLPALIKHHLSLVLLLTSFIWFIFTIVQNYLLLATGIAFPEVFLHTGLIGSIQFFSDALPYLSIVYLLMLGVHSAQFFKNLSANRILQTQGLTKAPIDIRLFTAKTALHLGIKKKVRVWLSDRVDVPSVTGFIKPIILLPASIINNLSVQQTEAILLHELAHIRRNDYLVNFLQSLVELTLFFNPFAIWLGKAVKKERENCCDDWVMNFQYDHFEYAKALLVLEEQRHLLLLRFVLTATDGKKNLLQRIKRLFNAEPQTNFSSLQKFKLIGLCFLLVTGMFIIFPFMKNKSGIDKAGTYYKKEKLNLAKFDKIPFDKIPREIFSKNTFARQTVKSVNEKGRLITYNKTKQHPAIVPAGDYVNAFVNEELLNNTISQSEVEPILARVVEKEIKTSKYLVKIVEQQSGKNQTNTYYFELNKKDGNTAIKPLMMLNKIKAPLKKIVTGILPDSLDTSLRPNKKKRITS